MCAMRGGVSVDTSMGMTTLGGLPMGTRCGDLDSGAVLYLIRECGMSPEHIEHELYYSSGLKALSGTNGDIKTITHNLDPDSRFAFDYFVLHVAQSIASMSVSMGKVDAVIFTGGIGENSEDVRKAVLDRISFMPDFTTLVIPTNEEHVIAEQVYKIAAPL